MTATLALADRLARLERTVATLQQQQPGSEALQQNILTIDPRGNVSVVLQGGLTVPVTQTDPPSFADAVTFERTDGTNAGQLYLDDAGGPQIVLKATADPSTPAPASIGIRLSGSGGNATALLLEDNGVSSFLQLALAQNLHIDLGTATITWPGGSPSATPASVSHGLGRTPTVVLANPQSTPGTVSVTLAAFARSSTAFSIGGTASANATGTITFDWIAIG